MMEKRTKQQSVEIWPVLFHKYDPKNTLLGNTGNILVVLQPTSTLHSVLYPISKSNSLSPFNLLMILKQNKWWWMNTINDGEMNCMVKLWWKRNSIEYLVVKYHLWRQKKIKSSNKSSRKFNFLTLRYFQNKHS